MRRNIYEEPAGNHVNIRQHISIDLATLPSPGTDCRTQLDTWHAKGALENLSALVHTCPIADVLRVFQYLDLKFIISIEFLWRSLPGICGHQCIEPKVLPSLGLSCV